MDLYINWNGYNIEKIHIATPPPPVTPPPPPTPPLLCPCCPPGSPVPAPRGVASNYLTGFI